MPMEKMIYNLKVDSELYYIYASYKLNPITILNYFLNQISLSLIIN